MSAIMAINNVSMEEQIGMLTGVTEITRNASSASRGLVMVSSRLTQVLDDTSSTGKKLTKIYNDLGIELKDENGQLRGHYEILGDLAGQWDNLSENEQKYIALTSAGARQQQNFVALMENWNQVAKATATAYQSMGSAQKENEKVMDSISKKVEILKSQFQQLVIGKGGLQELAKTFLNVGIAILKFANSDTGKTIIQITALITAISLLTKGIISLGTNITTKALMAIAGLTAEEAAATIGTLTFSEAIEVVTHKLYEMAIALLENPIFWVGAALVATIAIFNKFNVTIEESAQALQEFKDSINQNEQDLENLKSQLDNVNDSIERIKNQEHITIADAHELVVLQKQSEELERQVALKEQELEVSKQLAEEEAKRNIKKSGVEIGGGFSTTQSKALEYYTDQIEELTNKQKELEKQGKENSKEYTKLTDKINEAKEKGNELAIALQNDADALISEDDATQGLKKSLTDLIDSYLILTDESYAWKKQLENQLDEYSKLDKGGHVDLKLRPVIDTEELNKQGYDAGKGYATIFTHTFTNESNNLAVNFTPIMTDENGKYLGVMQKDAFEKYCNDVVNGVHDDYKNLQIGVGFKKEDYDDFIEAAEEAAEKEHELSDAYVRATGAADELIRSTMTYEEAVDEFGDTSEEADSILKDLAKDLSISEEELLANAQSMGLSVETYHDCALAIKEADDAIDNFQSSLGTLQSAVDEYNESQYLSIDTVQSLLQLQPEYLSMLVEENGQLKLNENAIVDKCNALIEERKQTALQMAYDRLAAIERGENAEAATNQASSIDGNTDSLNTETAALSRNTVEQYANRIARNDKSKGTAASQVVRELEKELSMLDKIGNSYGKISKSATKAGRSGSSGAKSAKDAQKELNKELEETKKKYEQVIKYINKRYDREIKKIKDAKSEAIKAEEKKIKAVEKEKDHALDAIEKQIKALKKEQDARKKYWSDRIDALKKQNDALKDSLELQEKLDALEKAKNTRVKIYKEGQGFVYDVDQTAVAQAQKELDEYLSQKAYEDELERLEALKDAELDNYEKRLDALNEYKDSVQENYEKQIEQMNEYKDQLSEQYDAQIDKWEEYKEQFGDLVDQYEEQQNKLLFEQLMGIKDENSNWLTRLDNLAEFVRKYNELQNKLNTGDTSVTNTAKMKEGTGGGSGTRSTNYQSTKTSSIPQYDNRGFKLNEGYSSTSSSSSKTAYVPTGVAKALGGKSGKINYASGTPSIKDDQIAIVGENPNQEIVIGSKINNGELMNLGKGTGVVNADSSKTLAGMLNQVGQFGASGFGSGNGTLNNNINNDSLVINGVTVQGANIKDPETFVNGLLNLKAEALQRAYRHR